MVIRDPELLTTGQVAELLGTSRQHVVDLCKRGVLPCSSAGTHRRIRRADVDSIRTERLTRDQERALWLHRVVAGRLMFDPDGVLARAGANLARLKRVHPGGMAARWLTEWERVLAEGVDAVVEALTSSAPRFIELRQNSPFAGVLTDDERHRVLENFRQHWRSVHAT